MLTYVLAWKESSNRKGCALISSCQGEDGQLSGKLPQIFLQRRVKISGASKCLRTNKVWKGHGNKFQLVTNLGESHTSSTYFSSRDRRCLCQDPDARSPQLVCKPALRIDFQFWGYHCSIRSLVSPTVLDSPKLLESILSQWPPLPPWRHKTCRPKWVGRVNGEKADLLCWGCWWEIKLRTERIQSRMHVPYRLGDVLEPSYQYSWLQIGCYPEPAATTMDRKSIHWMSCSGSWQNNLHHPNKSIRIEDRWSSDSQVRWPQSKGLVENCFPFDQDWTYRNLRTVEQPKHNLHTIELGSTFCNSFLAWSVGNANLAHCYCPFLSLGAPKWSPHETKRSGYILLHWSREITWRCKKENTILFLFLR